MDLWVIGTLFFAFLTLVALVISTIFLARTLNQETKLRTLEYVTGQFDMLERIRSRKELRKLAGKSILDYVNGIPEVTRDSVIQKLLQYVYAFNRIGAGMYKKVLREDVIFQIWTPKWFEAHWQKWESFIAEEKKRRGEEASRAYMYFQWLAEIKCPKANKKYPEYQPKT